MSNAACVERVTIAIVERIEPAKVSRVTLKVPGVRAVDEHVVVHAKANALHLFLRKIGIDDHALDHVRYDVIQAVGIARGHVDIILGCILFDVVKDGLVLVWIQVT